MDLPTSLAVIINPQIGGLIAIAAGILVLVFPKILNYIIAFYLIAVGAIALLG